MTRLCIVCEGATEVEFVKTVVLSYLQEKEVYAYPCVLQAPSGRHRGGRVTVQRLVDFMAHEAYNCDYISCFVDYYGFKDRPSGKKEDIEQEILKGLHEKGVVAGRAIPYLQMHEFEALLFSDVNCFEYVLDGWNEKVRAQLVQIRQSFTTPECINDSPDTAPSKRILQVFPVGTYNKVIDGPIVAEAIGIERICQECPGFSAWLESLCALSEK